MFNQHKLQVKKDRMGRTWYCRTKIKGSNWAVEKTDLPIGRWYGCFWGIL